jgi:hypothetical protein
MATVHTPPIDLYAESQDREWKDQGSTPREIETSPRENGDRDEPAIDAGLLHLERVLGC